jgi:hypothetical protein
MASSLRAWWLLIAFLSGMALAMFAENLILKAHDNRIEFSTPYPFLSGQPLLMARLKNAVEVPILIQTTLFSPTQTQIVRHAEDRFVVSFDLWQESYSVVQLREPRKRAAHLTAKGVENWCMSQMSLDASGLSNTQPMWARLDIRAEDPPKDGSLFGRGKIDDSGISLTPLIDIFSRPAHAQQAHFGPFNSSSFTLQQLLNKTASFATP